MTRTQWPQDSSRKNSGEFHITAVFSGTFCQAFIQSESLVKDSCSVITGHDIKWHQDGSSRWKMCLSCNKRKEKERKKYITVDSSKQFIVKILTKTTFPLRFSTFLYRGQIVLPGSLQSGQPAFAFTKQQKYYPSAAFDTSLSIIHRCAPFFSST